MTKRPLGVSFVCPILNLRARLNTEPNRINLPLFETRMTSELMVLIEPMGLAFKTNKACVTLKLVTLVLLSYGNSTGTA